MGSALDTFKDVNTPNDPNEILAKIKAHKKREAGERAKQISEAKAEAKAAEDRAAQEKLQAAITIGGKLEEVAEILERKAGSLKDFVSEVRRIETRVEKKNVAKIILLTVAKTPPGIVEGMSTSGEMLPTQYMLRADGDMETGKIKFSFSHKGIAKPVSEFECAKLEKSAIYDIFISFVMWFGELAY